MPTLGNEYDTVAVIKWYVERDNELVNGKLIILPLKYYTAANRRKNRNTLLIYFKKSITYIMLIYNLKG